jgi:DNA-binding CsgD family transcriptional regulator
VKPECSVEGLASLEEVELDVLELVARGCTDKVIGVLLSCQESEVKRILRRAQDKLAIPHAREMAGYVYVRKVLPTDVRRTPGDAQQQAYTAPGQKLEEWTTWAQETRARMVTCPGMSSDRVALLARILIDPKHVVMGVEELIPFMGAGLTVYNVMYSIKVMLSAVGLRTNRTKLQTVLLLAPLDNVLERRVVPLEALRAVQHTIAQLEERDLRYLGLIFEGRSDEQIAAQLFMSVDGLHKRVRRIRDALGLRGCSREYLAWFYLRFALPLDVLGTPLDRRKATYTEPGEKLAEWVTWAKIQRENILNGRNLASARAVRAASLLAEPRNLGKNSQKLGAMLHPKATASEFEGYLQQIGAAIGATNRVRIMVITLLAPLTF